uniref:Uncharacterized protein n=1 Tax=Ixodes ricinus TaxID=34613 RepID=A0A6B0UZ15_IXORI
MVCLFLIQVLFTFFKLFLCTLNYARLLRTWKRATRGAFATRHPSQEGKLSYRERRKTLAVPSDRCRRRRRRNERAFVLIVKTQRSTVLTRPNLKKRGERINIYSFGQACIPPTRAARSPLCLTAASSAASIFGRSTRSTRAKRCSRTPAGACGATRESTLENLTRYRQESSDNYTSKEN